MGKPLFMLTAIASLVASTLVNAGENYNYSHITVGAGFGNSEIDELTIDETSWFVRGAYKLDSLPFILEAGYAYSSVNDDELVNDADLDGHIYFVGSKFVISPTERLDILPGIAVGRTDSTATLGSGEVKTEITSYTASLDVRFHLERGLWLTTGYAYQDYNEKLLDKSNFFNIGAEYVVNDDWALGLDYHTTSDNNLTRLFAKVFY
ncbi:outer membrane beta-barrel protein [Salinisphaera sp. G21_0]|uniref:outer membrane beta-barrel protein n=1 Tax=Salinisphaera sp. G21_0 TaxID=2821094 RepID=UPI001AD9B7E7|nr:outer membrane beta-barrel protein [Salinisphaera sp. G21_0]MBO9481338.1 outer membrane beta-barrel protein [Salinisphaera sp. G21_0]